MSLKIEEENFIDDKKIEINKQAEEERNDFREKINYLSDEDQKLIMDAYSMAEAVHREKTRDSGESYFEHLRGVALILIDECQIKNPNLIIASLLHDSIEESKLFGDSSLAYPKWREVSEYRLSNYFNSEVAEMVIALTRPGIDGGIIHSDKESHELYFKNLEASSSKTILIKMCDRLHNLRTLAETTPEKRHRKLLETKEVYLDLFERKVFPDFPELGVILLGKINSEIRRLEAIDNL